MPVEVRIPTLGESVTEGVIVRWIKGDGETVAVDEPLLELETDKASVEIPAEVAGVLSIVKKEGETVAVGDVVARIEADGAGKKPKAEAKAPAAPAAQPASPEPKPPAEAKKESASAPQQKPSPAPQAAPQPAKPASEPAPALSPAVRKLVEENALDAGAIKGTGPGGRITKEDVSAHLQAKDEEPAQKTPVPVQTGTAAKPVQPQIGARQGDERVPMSRIRQRIAERLVQVQHTAAILTTFNEIDLSAMMEMRARHKTRFAETHGVALGFMSFFARAAIAALRDVPVVNAAIDGADIVYHSYVNLGIAVATERGLVVPVIKNAHALSFAQIEAEIARLAGLARDSKLGPDDLSGGTFSITNGGVFGSLLSTPILNPPQSAILGMHKTEKRPVVVDDAVVVRPMMYVALSYDHRLIDGEQAVTFLVRIKERLEDPARLLLEV
jgi:2-oxoglutarate dehydrogenase E2 component (dihydrolipoamide succinyltransferase)